MSTPFVVQDLWEKITPDGTGAVVVVTVAADPSVAAVHDRMPAIVGLEGARAWLAGTVEEAMGGSEENRSTWNAHCLYSWTGRST